MFKKTETKQDPDFEIFVIHDSKVGGYRQPIFAINKFDMLRHFENTFREVAQSKEQNQYFTNAEDFALFKIGEYSKKTGTIQSHLMEHVANLHDIKSVVMRSITINEVRDAVAFQNAENNSRALSST